MRISNLLATVLEYFIYLLIARVIVDYIRIFKRDWPPRGVILVIVEAIILTPLTSWLIDLFWYLSDDSSLLFSARTL